MKEKSKIKHRSQGKLLKKFDPGNFEFAAQLELSKKGSYVVKLCIMKLTELTTILQNIIFNKIKYK